MNEQTFTGGPVMVKIDGSRIRSIREAKGLTQLYIATAVEVTTDTVSRWENRRYPSIKKENALRLAQALEVELEDILDREDIESKSVGAEDYQENDSVPGASAMESLPEKKAVQQPRLPLRLLFFGATVIVVLLLALFWFRSDKPVPPITVNRVVSPHFIAGQPLPVFIQINTPPETQLSVIIRENLPPGSILVKAFPDISGKDKKDTSIKWLRKISGPTTFFYTIKSDSSFKGQFSFSGTVKLAASGKSSIEIGGRNSSLAGLHHWADLNGDNRINDEEILAVYDLAVDDIEMGIDMDLIEEIWLGEGYIWQPDKGKFKIID